MRVDHTLLIERTLNRATTTLIPIIGTQPPNDLSEGAELCETATRKEHIATSERRQLTHKHKRSVDGQRAHTTNQRHLFHSHGLNAPTRAG